MSSVGRAESKHITHLIHLMANSFASNKIVCLFAETQTQEYELLSQKIDDYEIFTKFDYFEVKFPFLRDNALGSMLSAIKVMCH